jgi:hypothetical protein
MWPFKTRSPLSSDDEEWQLETWRWLLEQLGGIDDLRAQPLVLPNADFFPPIDARGHERAEHVFETIKQLMGLQSWHCKLVPQPDRPDARVSDVAYLKFENGTEQALGTFGAEGNEIVITYDPGLIGDPVGLVATLAHELSHYLLSAKGEPPGGWENHEFCTDLGVVYSGFGLFGAATAFRYYAGAQGWGYSKAGYLSQVEWSFALAVYLALRDQPVADAKPWLPSHIYAGVVRATKYLASQRSEQLSALKAVRPPPLPQFQSLSFKSSYDDYPVR